LHGFTPDTLQDPPHRTHPIGRITGTQRDAILAAAS
jgi:hypothetical protein